MSKRTPPEKIYKNGRLTKAAEEYFEFLLENGLNDIIQEVFYPKEKSKYDKEWLYTQLEVGEKYFRWKKNDHLATTDRGYTYNTDTRRKMKPTIINRMNGEISGCFYYQGESVCIPKEYKKRGWEYNEEIQNNLIYTKEYFDKNPKPMGRARKTWLEAKETK